MITDAYPMTHEQTNAIMRETQTLGCGWFGTPIDPGWGGPPGRAWVEVGTGADTSNN
jgi:hypothetical protein